MFRREKIGQGELYEKIQVNGELISLPELPKFTVPFCSQYREHPSFHVPSAFVPPHHFPEAVHLERGIQVRQRLLTIRGKCVVFPYTPRTVPFIRPSPLYWTSCSVTCTGGVLPYERLMRMYRWMGWHFPQSYQNGVAHFRLFQAKTVFHIYGQQTYQNVCTADEKCVKCSSFKVINGSIHKNRK